MRFGGRRESDNVESQAGGLGGGFGGGGGGGGAAMLLGLVFSRFGIGGVVVVIALMFFPGGNPLGLVDGEQGGAPSANVETRGATACSADPARHFSCQV